MTTTATTTATTDLGAGVVEVSAADLKAMDDRGEALIVDIREPDEHRRERIAGAVNVPLAGISAGDLPEASGRTVVLHCAGGVRSAQAARAVLARGAGRACHLAGGLSAWKAAGFAVERTPRAPLPMIRQVHLTVGPMIIAGVLLGAFVSPWWLVLPGAVGAGLLAAGATGFCGLAAVLGTMPWNRAPSATAR